MNNIHNHDPEYNSFSSRSTCCSNTTTTQQQKQQNSNKRRRIMVPKPTPLYDNVISSFSSDTTLDNKSHDDDYDDSHDDTHDDGGDHRHFETVQNLNHLNCVSEQNDHARSYCNDSRSSRMDYTMTKHSGKKQGNYDCDDCNSNDYDFCDDDNHDTDESMETVDNRLQQQQDKNLPKNTSNNTSNNVIGNQSLTCDAKYYDSPPLLPSSSTLSSEDNTPTAANITTDHYNHQALTSTCCAYTTHTKEEDKNCINSHDFYHPRLTLTMSDKPTIKIMNATANMNNDTWTKPRRCRAGSVPSCFTTKNNTTTQSSTAAAMNMNTTQNTYPTNNTTSNTTKTPTKTTTATTSIHRKQIINLSLSIPTPKSPIPAAKTLLSLKSKQAKQAFQQQNQILQQCIRNFREKHAQQRRLKIQKRKELKELKKQLKKQSLLERQNQQLLQKRKDKTSSIILLKSNGSLKLLWDALTILITIASAIRLHEYIRDRSTYEYDAFSVFSNIWFGIDLLLNFITDHRTSDGTVIRTGREVAGRYLTTWFAVDALSLLPWERMFVRPIILMQNRRNIVMKWFFRSKAVVKVTRYLGKRKFLIKYFKNVSKETKKVGVGANKLVHLLIKYIPKYLLFYRNMKGVLLLKTLRQVHYLKKFSRGLTAKFYQDNEEEEGESENEEKKNELDHHTNDNTHEDNSDDDEEEEEEEEEDDYDDVLSATSVASIDLDDFSSGTKQNNRNKKSNIVQNLDIKFNFSLDDNRMSSLKALRARSSDEAQYLKRLDVLSSSPPLSRIKRRPRSIRNIHG